MAEQHSSKPKEFFDQKTREEQIDKPLGHEEIEDKKQHITSEEADSGYESDNQEKKVLEKKDNPEEKKEEQVEKREEPEKKKGSKMFTIIFFTLCVLFLACLGGKIQYSIFKSRPELYGKYFYTWRINDADEIMVKGPGYKKIKLNTIDPKNKNALAFRNMAEAAEFTFPIYDNDGKKVQDCKIKGLISFTEVPVHLPRGPSGHYTLVDSVNFKFYYDLLKLRAITILNLSPEKREEPVSDQSKALVLDKLRIAVGNFPLKQIFTFFARDKDSTNFINLKKDLFGLLNNIYGKKTGYTMTDKNTKLSDNCLKDIRKIINHVYPESDKNNKKISDDQIIKFFTDFGKIIKVRAQQSLTYSSIFTFFYLCTLDVDLAEIKFNDEKRVIHVARMFAKIFSRIYEQDWSYDPKDLGLSWLENFFGKKYHCGYTNNKAKEDYKKVIEKDEENIQALLSSA